MALGSRLVTRTQRRTSRRSWRVGAPHLPAQSRHPTDLELRLREADPGSSQRQTGASVGLQSAALGASERQIVSVDTQFRQSPVASVAAHWPRATSPPLLRSGLIRPRRGSAGIPRPPCVRPAPGRGAGLTPLTSRYPKSRNAPELQPQTKPTQLQREIGIVKLDIRNMFNEIKRAEIIRIFESQPELRDMTPYLFAVHSPASPVFYAGLLCRWHTSGQAMWRRHTPGQRRRTELGN